MDGLALDEAALDEAGLTRRRPERVRPTALSVRDGQSPFETPSLGRSAFSLLRLVPSIALPGRGSPPIALPCKCARKNLAVSLC